MSVCGCLPFSRKSSTSASRPIVPSTPNPFHQSINTDRSRHETVYGSYSNRGYHASGHGIINNFHQSPSILRDELEKRCSHSAAFDSAARFDPPRCTESTRFGIIQTIEDWVNSGGDSPSLFWLHGGAGKRSNKEQREPVDSDSGFTSVGTFKGIASFIESQNRDPEIENQNREPENRDLFNRAIFTKTYDTQIRGLLVEPLLALKLKVGPVTHPRLIVIDGLDECHDPDIQRELLRVIARAIRQIPYPLRFLVTSRPEAHITRVFDHDRDLQAITVRRYNLSDDPDADMDIRIFLETEFLEIRRVHSIGQYLPDEWHHGALTSLVERSSGHFIYASTVIRYIQSSKHRPDDRLKVILQLRSPQDGDRPYAQLDALYALIFQSVENCSQLKKICLVLGMLYFHSKRFGIFSAGPLYTFKIEDMIEIRPGDLFLLVDPILSLIAIDGVKVRIFHKSLIDYLLDSTRGGHLPFDLGRVHESAATYVLKQMILNDMCDVYEFQAFAYHCQYGYLNDTLKDYLRSLNVPRPKSIITKSTHISTSENERLEYTLLDICYFFRAISREEIDHTGQVYQEYMAKWTRYLQHPAVTRRIQTQSKAGVAKMAELKRELNTLLTTWKPKKFNPMSTGADRDRRVAIIQQEHTVFLAYTKEIFSGVTNAIASSIVFGNHFIHSYNLGFRDDVYVFVTLRTYSMHGDACYQGVHIGGNLDRVMGHYLRGAEKNLLSELYQKYGVELDEDTSSI